MNRFYQLFVMIAILVAGSVSPGRTEVYLNEQWDTTFNTFMVKPLKLIGESITLNCDYQNAYGIANKLKPGPPFYIEDGIIIDNIYDDSLNVVTWGGLTVDAQSACSTSFVVAIVDNSTIIQVNGNLLIEGSTSNPVLFQGYVNFWSIYNGGDDTSHINSYDITFSNCVFDNPIYPNAIPFNFSGGNITFDGCVFSNWGSNFFQPIVSYDPYVIGMPRAPVWNFTMRNCLFQNGSFSATEPVYVGFAKSVVLENNHFENITYDADPFRGLVYLIGCGVTSVKDNTSHNTSLNAFMFDNCFVDDNAYLQSSNELPFIMGPFNIIESGTLEIGEGSILKMHYVNPGNNITVSGTLTAHSTVFTSWRDDSYGGNTDLDSTGSPLYWSRGIRVEPSGIINLTDCKVLYSEDGIVTQGNAFIDSCLFENDRHTLSLNGFDNNIFQVSNSTFRNNTFTGLSANCDSGSIQTLSLLNVSSLSNGADGLSFEFRNNNSIDATIDNCQLAGNGEYGIGVWYMSGSGSIDISNSFISANANDGIIANDYGIDNISFEMANNVIVGNGNKIPSGYGHDAVNIQTGNLNFINNTVGYSYGMGLKYFPSVTDNNDVVNNIFFNNGNYGVFKYTETTPLFANNEFWNDNGSQGELFFWTPSGGLYSVEDVATLGGEYASNLHLDPTFTPEIIDSISQFSYDSISNTSIIITDDSVFQNNHLEHTIIQPDTSKYPWFYILRNTNDSLFILGDIRNVADTGDAYRIFNHHLLDVSPLVDAGRNASVIGFYDIDREDRIIDGDSNDVAIVDIGADEYYPGNAPQGQIVITSPKAGDVYLAGDTCNIKWNADYVDMVNLHYVTDYDSTGTNFWQIIDSNINASLGNYQWKVPKMSSAMCKIMIEDAQDTTTNAQSELFTIIEYIQITSPEAGELYLVGDTCDINWNATEVDTVNLYYATHFNPTGGNLWQVIDSNIDASRDSYQWQVPDELSAKCKIMIVNAQDTIISTESDLFKIKPYILTRFDSTGEYEAFSVQQDGWSFPNDSAQMWPDTMWQNYDYTGDDPYTHLPYPAAFAGSPRAVFPDWPLFVEAFDINNCYYALPPNSSNLVFYRLWAVKKWKSISHGWHGSCFGFSNSSMLAFIDKPFVASLDGIGDFNNLMDFEINSAVRTVINKYQIYQWGRQFTQLIREQPVPSGIHTFEDCRQMLAVDSALQNDRVLLFWWYRAGHAVTPYECRPDTGTLWRIYVYDNNYPGDSAKFVEVDTATNNWYYAPLDVGFYGGNMQLSDPLFDYYGNAQPNFSNSATWNENRHNISGLNDVSGFTEFYITSIDSISFVSPLGTIGRYGDSSFNNLTLGQPILPFVGQQGEPLGYILPDSSWTCQFSGFNDSVVPLRIFTDSTVMTYFNEYPNSVEKVYYQGHKSSLWVFNTSNNTNAVTFEGDAVHPDSEIVIGISALNILAGDSVQFSITDQSGLRIENKSHPSSYDLNLLIVGSTVHYTFYHEDISIIGGGVHIIAPSSDDLDNNQLKILLDNDDNGVIDDTLLVDNIYTGVNNDQFTALPDHYELSQNYPNPFNPVTAIKYSLPRRSHVTIEIFNILGQRIRTLVNENKAAGSYTITWDGISALGHSVSTGVYLYRIKADDYVATKKMLLLK